MLQARWSQVQILMGVNGFLFFFFFQFTYSFKPHYGPGFIQPLTTSWGVKHMPAHKADNLTATTCYIDSFTSLLLTRYWKLTSPVKTSQFIL
jgi:hypothetical protein